LLKRLYSCTWGWGYLLVDSITTTQHLLFSHSDFACWDEHLLGDSYPFQCKDSFVSSNNAPPAVAVDYAFELIDCELLDGITELLTEQERSAAKLLAQHLPLFLEDWFSITQQQAESNRDNDDDDEKLNALLRNIPLNPAQQASELPSNDALRNTMKETYWNELAMFTTAILSENDPSLTLDVRLAMLLAGTPFQRLLLATAAIKNQLQRLE
jgi:hypothetical protein